MSEQDNPQFSDDSGWITHQIDSSGVYRISELPQELADGTPIEWQLKEDSPDGRQVKFLGTRRRADE